MISAVDWNETSVQSKYNFIPINNSPVAASKGDVVETIIDE